MTRSFYWCQDICPCDLDHLWNWPFLGAFLFHKHILLLIFINIENNVFKKYMTMTFSLLQMVRITSRSEPSTTSSMAEPWAPVSAIPPPTSWTTVPHWCMKCTTSATTRTSLSCHCPIIHRESTVWCNITTIQTNRQKLFICLINLFLCFNLI